VEERHPGVDVRRAAAEHVSSETPMAPEEG
jgi:hypothetical protein